MSRPPHTKHPPSRRVTLFPPFVSVLSFGFSLSLDFPLLLDFDLPLLFAFSLIDPMSMGEGPEVDALDGAGVPQIRFCLQKLKPYP